jgi:hypothetical protein
MDGVYMISLMQSIGACYIYFISFYTSKSKTWNAIGPFIHLIVSKLVFLVFPVIGIILTLVHAYKYQNDETVLFLFYLSLCIQILFNYFSRVLRVVTQTWEFYSKMRSNGVGPINHKSSSSLQELTPNTNEE